VPRYSPLPSVSFDPRNEAELVQAASQRVYQASNQTLNDFSAGNPLAALIEGQVFAQGEFLFWADQLPQKILTEWVGPFLGAMRRLGTAAVARLVISVNPANTATTIPSGTFFTTDPNLTGGEAYSFFTYTDILIPAGESIAYAPVYSQYVGSVYNVPAFSITGASAINVTGLTVVNPQPATGGSDVETFQEVQERFFTLIRRKNPVSEQDWQDFFIDFYGVGTLTSVQPNRSAKGAHNYLTNYLLPTGQVSFFVLGPDGVELTQTQLERGQNVVNFSVPVGMQGHLYPITLSQAQYNLTVEVDANGSYGANLRSSSLDFRDRLYQVLQPGNVFPASIDPTVSDADAAFYSTFDTSVRYSDPHIQASAVYNTPPLLDASSATYTRVLSFESNEYLLNQNDLVKTPLPLPTFRPVTSGFTPFSSAKKDQTIYGNLTLQQIRSLTAGAYRQGQVVFWDVTDGGDGLLHVILDDLTLTSKLEISSAISSGKISPPKTYSAWVVGNTYQQTSGTTYNPQIVEYDYAYGDFQPLPGQSTRPGWFVWVVSANFVLEAPTNTVTSSQAASLLGAPVIPQELIAGNAYTAGTWVYTPQVGSGPDPVADPYYNYVDIRLGAINKYAYVVANFTYDPNSLTVSSYFDELISQVIINEVAVEDSVDGLLPIYKYSPRFPVGTHLEYRTDRSSMPQYYLAAQYFTPGSTDAQTMVNQGLIFPLVTNESQLAQLTSNIASGSVRSFTRMFRFFRGDRTFFRQGNSVISYTAVSSVTPLFNFQTYLQNGVFVLTSDTTSTFTTDLYIPYFNPDYVNFSEDTVLSADGRNMYRVMRAFTPAVTVTDWTNTAVANTARIQEYAGNLLRYVDEYTCEQPILSQLGRNISGVKLGIAQITLIPKNKGRFNNSQERITYIWENTSTLIEAPQLSWSTGSPAQYNPPNYAGGTLAL